MPQFILQLGETHAAFDALPEFAQGYIEAAFFTGPRPDDCGEGEGDDCPQCGAVLEVTDCGFFVFCPAHGCEFVSSGFTDQAGPDQLAPESFEGLAGEAVRFMRAHAELVNRAAECYGASAAGNDLWYTSNGYGVGYWCRDELPQDLQDALSAAAQAVREIDLYTGDDLRIHASPCPDPEPMEPAAPPLLDVSSRYGAPMGRGGNGEGPAVAARRVTLDAGGYDSGGAYWGLGESLYMLQNAEGEAVGYTRAATESEALK